MPAKNITVSMLFEKKTSDTEKKPPEQNIPEEKVIEEKIPDNKSPKTGDSITLECLALASLTGLAICLISRKKHA